MYSIIKNSKKKNYSTQKDWKIDIGKNSLQKVMEWSVNHLSRNKWTRVRVSHESQNLSYSSTTFGNGLRVLTKIGVLDRTKEFVGIQYRIAENADLSKEDTEFAESETESEIETIADNDLVPYIENHVIEVRGERGLLDCDLAEIYGVSTSALNRARKRNLDRFPNDFAFQINEKEKDRLCQNGTTYFSDYIPNLPWFYTREGCNQASTVLNTKTAVERSIVIMRTFSDLERSAHGVEPKQDGFKELIAGIATNIFTPVNQQLQAITNGVQSNADKINSTQKSLNQVKYNMMREKLQAQRKRYKQTSLELGRIEKKLYGPETQYWVYWEDHRRRYGYKASETPLPKAKGVLEDMKERISKGIDNKTYPVETSELSSKDKTFLAQIGITGNL